MCLTSAVLYYLGQETYRTLTTVLYSENPHAMYETFFRLLCIEFWLRLYVNLDKVTVDLKVEFVRGFESDLCGPTLGMPENK